MAIHLGAALLTVVVVIVVLVIVIVVVVLIITSIVAWRCIPLLIRLIPELVLSNSSSFSFLSL